MTSRGEIPCYRVGSKCLFSERIIEAWLEAQLVFESGNQNESKRRGED